ncbi:MAG TPA: cupredoxin domain-containing protein [Pyrinomonadaceae bacterium]|nr:cupredoxin domain-containing protein [Pyrinomonadaceae bacterium]
MDTSEIFVLAAGVALIAFVLWYFFGGEGERAAASVTASGVQRLKVLVKGGYTPDVIVVKRGAPVELDFYRDETNSCTEQVVFGDFQISRSLPAFKTTRINFTPERAGTFVFNCGMNMVRGKLVVED